MKNPIILILLFSTLSFNVYSQNDGAETRRGIVKVQKTGLLAFIKFDEVNYRLIGIDRYGNVLDTAVLQFSVQTNIRGIAYSESISGNTLSVHLQQILSRRDTGTILYFSNVRAKDQKGTLINMPDFKFVFRHNEYDAY